MTPQEYSHEIETRGGKAVVAAHLGITISTINKRCSGQHAVTNEAALAVQALPEDKAWQAQTVNRIASNANFREKFRSETLKMKFGPLRSLRASLLSVAGWPLDKRNSVYK